MKSSKRQSVNHHNPAIFITNIFTNYTIPGKKQKQINPPYPFKNSQKKKKKSSLPSKREGESTEQGPISSGSSANNRWPRRKSASVRYVGVYRWPLDARPLPSVECVHGAVNGFAENVDNAKDRLSVKRDIALCPEQRHTERWRVREGGKESRPVTHSRIVPRGQSTRYNTTTQHSYTRYHCYASCTRFLRNLFCTRGEGRVMGLLNKLEGYGGCAI